MPFQERLLIFFMVLFFYLIEGASFVFASGGVTKWHNRETGTETVFFDVAYGLDRFVAGGQGTIISSADGMTWIQGTLTEYDNFTSVSFYEDTFYAAGYLESTVLKSTDGLDWTLISRRDSDHFNDIASGNDVLVAVGYDSANFSNTIYTSSDGGLNFTKTETNTLLNGLTFVDGRFIAVGADFHGGLSYTGKIFTSVDGQNWTSSNASVDSQLYDVAHDKGMFVAVGSFGKISTSDDSLSWTERNSGVSDDLMAVTYGNGYFVAVGKNGTIITSQDGISWTSQSSGTTNLLRGVGFGGNTFVTIGDNSPASDQYSIFQSDTVIILADLDDNDEVELRDAIIACMAMTNIWSEDFRDDSVASGIDVNGDGQVGLSEAIYALQVTSGIRNTELYKIVDTGVSGFYSDSAVIAIPSQGGDYYGQDSQYQGNQPSYTDNGDNTITDNVTGLMWQKDMGEKIPFSEAQTKAETLVLGGYNDWRVPTIKELYSLILFTGQVSGESAIEMFIDTTYFNQPLGDTSTGERSIDAQTWSSTEYVGKTMGGDDTVFGVNFVDGRIKGYPKYKKASGEANTMYFRMVRGNSAYGTNEFTDNADGTVSDLATSLMWQKSDDGNSRNWQDALSYCENLDLASYGDWRLPNAKELQSIVDYSRSPQTTSSPAINPVFSTTEINDPDGNPGQFPYFWTSTTHQDGSNPYDSAVYIAFGEGQGKMGGVLMDVHGAGCQRSDPKSGEQSQYPDYFGPQGDVRYVFNHARCVRDTD